MMRHYIYVVDDEGRELPNSRRSLDRCDSRAVANELWQSLERQLGEDCHLRTTVEDWGAYWQDREA
ncbi:MAG: hypothetical protein MK010_09450 [Erythrobacter sp.]|nr:hypothetical protein [Erythrobacter sp.]